MVDVHVCKLLVQGFTRQRGGRDSNPRPADGKSGSLTTWPPSHTLTVVEHVPYLSASAVVIHYEEALYQVYAPLPFGNIFSGNEGSSEEDLVGLCQ